MMMPFEWDVRVFLEGSHGGRTYVGNDRLGHHGLHHYAGLNSLPCSLRVAGPCSVLHDLDDGSGSAHVISEVVGIEGAARGGDLIVRPSALNREEAQLGLIMTIRTAIADRQSCGTPGS